MNPEQMRRPPFWSDRELEERNRHLEETLHYAFDCPSLEDLEGLEGKDLQRALKARETAKAQRMYQGLRHRKPNHTRAKEKWARRRARFK